MYNDFKSGIELISGGNSPKFSYFFIKISPGGCELQLITNNNIIYSIRIETVPRGSQAINTAIFFANIMKHTYYTAISDKRNTIGRIIEVIMTIFGRKLVSATSEHRFGCSAWISYSRFQSVHGQFCSILDGIQSKYPK